MGRGREGVRKSGLERRRGREDKRQIYIYIYIYIYI